MAERPERRIMRTEVRLDGMVIIQIYRRRADGHEDREFGGAKFLLEDLDCVTLKLTQLRRQLDEEDAVVEAGYKVSNRIERREGLEELEDEADLEDEDE
jgi:hypothetical protein